MSKDVGNAKVYNKLIAYKTVEFFVFKEFCFLGSYNYYNFYKFIFIYSNHSGVLIKN